MFFLELRMIANHKFACHQKFCINFNEINSILNLFIEFFRLKCSSCLNAMLLNFDHSTYTLTRASAEKGATEKKIEK